MDRHYEPETVPCMWCSRQTRMTYTMMCDGCWELHRRIVYDTPIARKMLEQLESKDVEP